MSLDRIKIAYRDLAIIVLNTIVIILLLNVILFAYFSITDRSTVNAANITDDRWPLLQTVYENWEREEVQHLREEMQARQLQYAPYTQFKERAYSGKYLHIDPQGFRYVSQQGPWPPEREKYFTVFLFGGSTTFGYGVPDDQTIASYLQQYLTESEPDRHVRVYNFGCESYYSTQERILFEQLISAGFKPDVAIFIDGLNDFRFYDDRPLYADKFESLIEGKLDQPPLSRSLRGVPMIRAVNSLRQRLNDGQKAAPPVAAQEEFSDPNVQSKVIKRYVKNKQMIESVVSTEGIRAFFVWQPIATYKYDQQYNLFAADAAVYRGWDGSGYPLMAKYVQEHPPGDNFLWCADMQQGMNEPLYVDGMHYSSKMSSALAKKIVDMMGRTTSEAPAQ